MMLCVCLIKKSLHTATNINIINPSTNFCYESELFSTAAAAVVCLWSCCFLKNYFCAFWWWLWCWLAGYICCWGKLLFYYYLFIILYYCCCYCCYCCCWCCCCFCHYFYYYFTFVIVRCEGNLRELNLAHFHNSESWVSVICYTLHSHCFCYENIINKFLLPILAIEWWWCVIMRFFFLLLNS